MDFAKGEVLEQDFEVGDCLVPPARDYTKRLRAYELFVAGVKKADIASSLGVSRMAVTKWSRQDSWDDRIRDTFRRSEEAVDFAVGNTVAETIARLRSSLGARLKELELMCSTGADPRIRLAAIKLWFELVASNKLPDPLEGASKPGQLELIADLGAPETPTTE